MKCRYFPCAFLWADQFDMAAENPSLESLEHESMMDEEHSVQESPEALAWSWIVCCQHQSLQCCQVMNCKTLGTWEHYCSIRILPRFLFINVFTLWPSIRSDSEHSLMCQTRCKQRSHIQHLWPPTLRQKKKGFKFDSSTDGLSCGVLLRFQKIAVPNARWSRLSNSFPPSTQLAIWCLTSKLLVIMLVDADHWRDPCSQMDDWGMGCVSCCRRFAVGHGYAFLKLVSRPRDPKFTPMMRWFSLAKLRRKKTIIFARWLATKPGNIFLVPQSSWRLAACRT